MQRYIRVRLSGLHGAILVDVSPTTQQRLFTPGTGATPPALTGREREQGVLTECLADLLGGTSPPHDVVLTGPRWPLPSAWPRAFNPGRR